MPQKDLGYVELEWTCKNCGTRNPGTRKNCVSCGAAMDAQTQYELPAQQVLITDEAKLAAAKAEPDIACPYCGTYNAATAKSCKQCGGDLQGAKARFKGGVLGAFDDSAQPDVKCQNCGTMNPASALKCSNCGASLKRPEPASQETLGVAVSDTKAKPQTLNPILIGAVVVVVLACIAGFIYLLTQRSDVTATVREVNWERTIAIMGQVPVRDADWQDRIPSGANVLSCELKPRRFSDVEEPNSVQVCGTPYVVDQGTGTGAVKQDCQYQVSEQYCSFTRLQWSVVNTVVSRGTDVQPNWPLFSLNTGEREGNRDEEYRVIFDAGGQQYTYKPGDANEFARFERGSRWNLEINGLGSIINATPAQ
jgi:hypothetical protein